MRSRVLSVLGTILCATLLGQDHVGGRVEGLGGVTSVVQDPWSVMHNSADLSTVERFSFAMAYRHWHVVPEVGQIAGAVALPLGKGSIGTFAQTVGLAGFRQSRATVSYGLRLFERFSLGAQINAHHIRFGKVYGSKLAVTGGLGVTVQASESVRLSTVITNLSRSRLMEHEDERLPTSLTMGVALQVSEGAVFYAECSKAIDRPLDVCLGVEYITGRLAMRTGLSSLQRQFTLGLGVQLGAVNARLGQSYGLQLGGATAMDLVVEKKAKEVR